MREHFRPYSLVAQLSNTNVSSINLTDSAGTALACNYVSVEGSGDGVGWFSVAASSISVAAATDNNVQPASALLGITSGLIGGIAPMSKGVVQFVLSDADRVSQLDLSLNTNDVTNLMISYGQVQTGNPLRDGERPIGN